LFLSACAAKPNPTPNPPVAAFDASPTAGVAPLPVTFTDQSTGTITTRQWDFGDSVTSSDQSPTHTYDGAGSYKASLTVTGPGGTNSVSHQIVVNARPGVNITAPQSGSTFSPGDQVAFAGTASDFEDGDLSSSIAWTSDIDGALGTGASINVSTLTSGTHTITASVTDTGGASANAFTTVTVNESPGVNITAPENGAGFVPGDQVTFTGTAADLEDGDLSPAIEWSSSIDQALGTGASINVSTLSSGTHTITASVKDTGGKTASDAITITINAAPVVSITAPQEGGSTVQSGDPVTFAASATDLEDGDLSSSIQWSSSIDNALGTGASISPSTLSNGSHTITASVTDTGGKTGTSSITLTVNAPPVVSITSPQNGATAPFGSPVNLTATATDPEDGNLSATIAWTSSLDGSLGTGASIGPSTLTIGTHTITASVTDTNGKTASNSITITVTNNAPVVVITAPENNASFSSGASVNFVGTANDTEDGSLTSGIAWTSSADGPIGTGGSFSTSSLSVGTHTITATVTDTGGKTASSQITITITAVNTTPVVAVTSPANNASFSSMASVNFAGTATDAEDGNLTSSIAWTSSADGAIGTGGSFSTSSLSVGTHTITATVTDTGGKTASVSITITITQLTPPTMPVPPTNPGCGGQRCQPPSEKPPGRELPGGGGVLHG
jgi:PKD repeat protein